MVRQYVQGYAKSCLLLHKQCKSSWQQSFLPLHIYTQLAVTYRRTGDTAWTLLSKELYNSEFEADEVRGMYPDYSQCCQLVRRLAGPLCVFMAGIIESIGRCISTVANYEEHGLRQLSLTTAVVCFPTPAKQLEAIIQAIQRAASSNAAAMRSMGIDCK